MGELTVCYFWSKTFPASASSVRRHAPAAERLYTGELSEDPRGYARHLRPRWDRLPGALLVLEQDIVITPEVVPSMAACPEQWCVYTYGMGTNQFPLRFGLGCTKFGPELRYALPFDRIARHNQGGNKHCPMCGARGGFACSDCPCCRHMDTIIRHELAQLGITEPHIHGHVRHLHRFGLELVSDDNGFYIWEVPGALH